ncbi:MAG: zinc-dependent dehydrogenase [Armatimonadota bacterium]
MITATYTQGGKYDIVDLPIPQIADDELLLRVEASSICGTDIRIIRSGHRKLHSGQRVVLGHEFAGVIEMSGSKARSFPVGTRVAVAPNIGCGRCEYCIQGLTNMCPDYSAFGINFDGAHAEYVRIPQAAISQGNVIQLPDSMSFADATIIEPLSCVVNGIRASRIKLGDTVVVFGAGPIGLMHMMLARISGAGCVMVIDVQQHRLDEAKRLGADIVVDSSRESARERIMAQTTGRGADVIITACPVSSVQSQSLELLAPYGRVCFFGGLPKDNSHVSLDTNLIHYKNLVVTGVTGGSPYDFRLAARLIETKRIDAKSVVSHRFATGDMAKAFDVSMNGETMKVIITAEPPVGVAHRFDSDSIDQRR